MTEFGYVERTTNFATSNNVLYSPNAAAIITGLDATVTGTGAAVLVEFYAPSVGHSAGATVTTYFVVNGAVPTATSQYRDWSNMTGGVMRRRVVLTNGTAYTFKVGLSSDVAGIATAYGSRSNGSHGGPGDTTGSMHLRITD